MTPVNIFTTKGRFDLMIYKINQLTLFLTTANMQNRAETFIERQLGYKPTKTNYREGGREGGSKRARERGREGELRGRLVVIGMK
jgi:hypothetical protein